MNNKVQSVSLFSLFLGILLAFFTFFALFTLGVLLAFFTFFALFGLLLLGGSKTGASLSDSFSAGGDGLLPCGNLVSLLLIGESVPDIGVPALHDGGSSDHGVGRGSSIPDSISLDEGIAEAPAAAVAV